MPGSSSPSLEYFKQEQHHGQFSRRRFSTTADSKKEEEKVEENEIETPREEQAEEETPNKEEQLEAEIKGLKDQLLRSLAEQENIRNIARRDVSAAKQFSIKSFAKSLLEVSDNLSRALDHVSEEDKTNSAVDSLYQGVVMTNNGLTKALEANGVKKYCEELGDAFDPTKHEALMEYLDPTKEPGTVGQVIKVGYTLNDRVLRPAEVGVVKKP